MCLSYLISAANLKTKLDEERQTGGEVCQESVHFLNKKTWSRLKQTVPLLAEINPKLRLKEAPEEITKHLCLNNNYLFTPTVIFRQTSCFSVPLSIH